MRHERVVVLAAVFALALGGCAKKAPAPAPAPAPAAQEGPAARPVDTEAEERARREAEEAMRRAEALERARAAIQANIYFDFDKYHIRPDQRATMDAKIPILRANPALRLRIEGHADERGSVEYNLALGMRRANSAKQYLTAFDLDPSRFEVVSYGEERPVCTEAHEGCWWRNRRAEFHIIAGELVQAPTTP